MKPKTIVAVILMAFGIVAFVYQVIAFRESRADASFSSPRPWIERGYDVPLPPLFGTIALITGISLLLVDVRDFERASAP